MENQANIYKLNVKKTRSKFNLQDHLNTINFNQNIKLRTRETAPGRFCLYLDFHKSGRRYRKSLNLFYDESNQNKSKESLIAAENVRAKHELEYFQDKTGFKLKHEGLKQSFIKFFEDQIPGRGFNDTKNWQHALMHLKAFRKDLTFAQVNSLFCEDFAKYLKENLSLNTANQYFSKLKACLNIAIKNGIIEANPARFIKIGKTTPQRMFLTVDEIQTLADTPCQADETKNGFLLACFTGLRISDLKRLKWDDLQGNYLYIRQYKTREPLRVKLSHTAQKIVEVQRTKAVDEYVFHIVKTDTKSSRHLHRWGQAALSKKITWHMARHSYAIMALSCGIDLYTLSKLLGHTEIRTTQLYARVLDNQKDQAIDRLPELTWG